MIFITGATGFIGNELISQLSHWQEKLRIMVPPAEEITNFPKNIPVEIVVSNLRDENNLRAALKDVNIIIHLASDEHKGAKANLMNVDIQGTAALTRIAQERKIDNFIFISHIGAEPSSAFPLLKAKGIAERSIIQSGIPYTILKTGPVFGKGDHFIDRLIQYLRLLPFITFVPDKGQTLLHPLHVDDLIAALLLVIDDSRFKNQQYLLGGPEYFSFQDICLRILNTMKRKKKLIALPGNTIRTGLLFAEQIWKNLPFSGFDLDYLAIDRTAPLDTLPRKFGILPGRLQNYLDIL